MIVLSLSTTYLAEKLEEADYILSNLESVTPEEVLRLISANRPPEPRGTNPGR